jgi:hypothetical protein
MDSFVVISTADELIGWKLISIVYDMNCLIWLEWCWWILCDCMDWWLQFLSCFHCILFYLLISQMITRGFINFLLSLGNGFFCCDFLTVDKIWAVENDQFSFWNKFIDLMWWMVLILDIVWIWIGKCSWVLNFYEELSHLIFIMHFNHISWFFYGNVYYLGAPYHT